MKKSQFTKYGTGLVALSFALAGCSAATPAPTATEETAETQEVAESLKIGLIMLQGDTYYQGILAGLTEAAEADGTELITATSNGDPAQEAAAIDNMIQAEVDAILMQPAADEASLEAMKRVKDAGITLICYGNCIDTTADPANVDGVIQSDNTALGTGTGAAAAIYIQENFGDSVSLAILNCDFASACKLRKAGFLEALESAGITVDIVTDQEAYLIDKAQPVSANILTANPDVDIFWASNEGGTAGAVIGTEGSGKPVFGTDISIQIAEFVLDAEGMLQATTGQDPVGTIQGAYEMAKLLIAGETLPQHSVEVPGITYDRANPATAEAFLAG